MIIFQTVFCGVAQSGQGYDMREINRLVFVSESDTGKGPMAAGAMGLCALARKYEIVSRGLVVLLPEPINEKAEAVMISNGIQIKDYKSNALTEEDFTDDTMVIAVERQQYESMLSKYDHASSVYLLEELIGRPVNYEDLRGKELSDYGKCFEQMMSDMRELAAFLNDREKERREEK